MLLPISIAVLIAALYVGLQQDVWWLDSARTPFDALLGSWTNSTPIANSTRNDWDILYHLGGIGPWIPKREGIVGDVSSLPEGCRVDQVHMLARHNERYPTHRTGANMVALHNRLRSLPFPLQGDLSFFQNWTFFMSSHYTPELGNLIPTGPNAGTLGAFKTGVHLRTLYPNLRTSAISSIQTNFWAADSGRVVETAKLFASGFWGTEWETENAKLVIIPESEGLGADTLTTGNTCSAYLDTNNNPGRHKGLQRLKEWQQIYLPPIIQRLETQTPGLNLSIHETFTMQEYCGFEILARGKSPWCDMFTRDEWLQYEYARDLLHYHRSGPGNKYSAARGFPFLNATANLLVAGPSAGSLFFSFVHDGDILPFVSALDLFPTETAHLPTDHAPRDRKWRTSDVVPMGARVVLERMVCPRVYCHSNAPLYPNHVYCDPPVDEPYVRVVVNDGVVAIPDCDDGPGKSCPLAAFQRRVMLRGWKVGDFGRLCGLKQGAPDRITFLHQ